MKKLMIALALVGLGSLGVNAQTTSIETPSKYRVATNSFWSNWYIQVGVDMSLQNPYGCDFSEVFPKGDSWGVNVAAGKWFTPGLGLRLKLNWENGIIKNDNNRPVNGGWTPDFEAGGYGAIYGDVQFNLSNMFFGYNENRVWNFIPYVGAGVVRNFDTSNYVPTLGAGIENTWKVSKLLNIYLDVAYRFTTKSFTVIESGARDKGTSGYLVGEVGVQFNLGKSTWTKAVSVDAYNALAASSEEALAKLRSDLDRERQINADLRAQLAKQPKQTETKTKVVTSAPTSVFFNLNSTKLQSKKDLVNLESLATTIKNSGCKVVITGSADSKTGSSAYNQKLSEGRAKAVADELVNLGVSRDKIEVKGIGGVNDVTPYTLNRRAVIELK